MDRGLGGFFDPPPQAGEKCIGRVEKREKKGKRWKNQAKIGKIRLIANRGNSTNLAKNMYTRLKIVSSYTKIGTIWA